MFWPFETRTSTCRSFATISSGLYRFLAIAVLLDVKDIPQVGPLQWGWIIGSQRLQEHNHLGTVLGRCEPAIRLHVIAGHDLIGCRDEAIELLLVPYKVRALHGAGIAVVLERTGFPSDDIVEVRTQADRKSTRLNSSH